MPGKVNLSLQCRVSRETNTIVIELSPRISSLAQVILDIKLRYLVGPLYEEVRKLGENLEDHVPLLLSNALFLCAAVAKDFLNDEEALLSNFVTAQNKQAQKQPAHKQPAHNNKHTSLSTLKVGTQAIYHNMSLFKSISNAVTATSDAITDSTDRALQFVIISGLVAHFVRNRDRQREDAAAANEEEWVLIEKEEDEEEKS
ncbi:hypothetical protein NUW58_g6037 [Xylaria curta]|uniref:Uncharacterized protein n=1 Tax=Xylaria curta TaxID=42375 RepID=A0ACC1NZW1_9PEZI|nr:hypothetical protein NUW58_g6037 [Xylaria curta]